MFFYVIRKTDLLRILFVCQINKNIFLTAAGLFYFTIATFDQCNLILVVAALINSLEPNCATFCREHRLKKKHFNHPSCIIIYNEYEKSKQIQKKKKRRQRHQNAVPRPRP